MINLLQKFKYVLGSATVQHITENFIYLNGKSAQIKLIGSDVNNLFKVLPVIATSNKPLAEVPCGHTFDYNSLIKGSLKEVELNNEHQLYAMFENCHSNQIVCENINLPQIKIGTDTNNHASIVNHAYIFDGCLWTTDARYLLKTDLHINSDIKAGIPARIYNLFKKIVWIGKNNDIVQICGNIDTKHQIVIQYKELEYLDKNINMLKSVNSPLDTCDDGIIYDLTEVTNLKLSTKKMKHLIRFNNGLLSVHDNTFNYNIADFKHEDFNQFGKFTIDGSYLNMFKRVFNKCSIFKVNRLRTRANNITLKQDNNSLLLMCIVD